VFDRGDVRVGPVVSDVELGDRRLEALLRLADPLRLERGRVVAVGDDHDLVRVEGLQ
jgi:hypothetical protein